jgi:O-acetyl-ADP-ribose deacetylase (regulator of RNase III)
MKYVTGDLMTCSEEYLVHGCNAQGVMGSGVARLIRDKWPKAFRYYRDAYDRGDLKLGTTVWVNVRDKVVINAITQDRYGTDRVHVDYEAGIRASFRKIN